MGVLAAMGDQTEDGHCGHIWCDVPGGRVTSDLIELDDAKTASGVVGKVSDYRVLICRVCYEKPNFAWRAK